MRELVDEDQRRVPGQRDVEIEFAQHRAAILDDARREDLEPLQQCLGLDPAVRLDVADDHDDAIVALLARRLQHRVRLADAGRGAEEHLELATALACFFFLDPGEERIRVGPGETHPPSVARTKLMP